MRKTFRMNKGILFARLYTNVMFVVGNQVKGGHYGDIPSLTNLAEGDNLGHTTDFRRVYQTMIQGWLGHDESSGLLNGRFQPFDMFS